MADVIDSAVTVSKPHISVMADISGENLSITHTKVRIGEV